MPMPDTFHTQEPEGAFYERAVKVGESAPDFELENFDGSILRLRDELNNGAVLLDIYRGHW